MSGNANSLSDIDSLVDRATNGDSNAFAKLYDIHIDRVYKHIYYRVGSTTDAEDLTQEVFIRAWQAIKKYKKTSSPFIAWLIRIGHNLVVDFYRSNKDKTYLDLDIVSSGSDSNPEDIAEVQFNKIEIRRAILELPGDQQQVILMRFIEGFSYPEIAGSISKKEGAVRVIQHRALSRLRKILDKVK